MTDLKTQLALLSRGCVEALPEGALAEQLAAALKESRPLRVKVGFDPTAPDLHLGHTVLLQKLALFQQLGHEVILIIGDFTARIGDPTGRSETRPQLTTEAIQANTRTYTDQVFRVLDRERTRVVFNGEWLGKMGLADLVALCARYNVAPMLTREDFSRRYREGHAIAIHEFLYPLMQGYDSVVLKPDIELGGSDQKFNLLVGRDLMRAYGVTPQSVMTMPLLEGTDGVRKMSKSYGNYVGVTEAPDDMFGKLMSISDTLMARYIELLTDWDLEALRADHPMQLKKRLAGHLVARYHGAAAGEEAAARFAARFSRGEVPDDLETVTLTCDGAGLWLPQLLVDAGLVPSSSEGRRRIQAGAVQVDGARVTDQQARIAPGGPYVVRAGKRDMKRVTLRPEA
ncbi:MAG: tyrosine--tRNA ligase [Nitrospirota bacterium]|nr:tyrosine--tRNA ligase [Nitrospirota bacterium]